MEAAWTSPAKFIEVVKARRTTLKPRKDSGSRSGNKRSLAALEDEHSLLDNFIRKANNLEDGFDAKIDRVCEAAIESAAKADRVVVMCTEATLADSIYRRINIRSNTPVLRCAPLKEKPETWLRKGILVCDGHAEEGLNLQGGATVLLHVDLPFSPNRIEQRMGRLDRIGKGKAVRSCTVVPAGATYLKNWLDLLNRGWRVFDRSIASLHYVVEDEIKLLRRQLFTDGSSAFDTNLLRLDGEKGVIAKELRAIHNQDALDALGPQNQETTALIEGIESYEKTADTFIQSLNLWLLDGLSFVRVGEQNPTDSVGRFHYKSPGRAGKTTLIAQTDFLHWFGKGIDETFAHPEFRGPLSWPLASHRLTAIDRRVGVARLGHPWIDAIEAHLRWDDRGTTVALWRHYPNAESSKIYLRFSAVVEANSEHLADWCRENSWANARTVSRLADGAFPPVELTVWIDPEFLEPDESLLKILTPSYDKRSGDINIAGARWTSVLERMNLTPQAWLNHCVNARAAAVVAVNTQSNLKTLIADRLDCHAVAHEQVHDQLLSRREILGVGSEEREQLNQDIARTTSLHEAIQASVKNVKVRFDTVGAIFISRDPLL